MKKTLLMIAAALAAGVISTQAQVYSQNIVGYVNLSITNGYHFFCTPLDADGTGTNNTVVGVLGTNWPVGTKVLAWNGSTFTVNQFVVPNHQTIPVWGSPNAPLNPGQGFFLYNPGPSTNLTITGNALVGTNVNNNLTPGGGYYSVASISPISGDITTNLNYTPTLNDQVLLWNDAKQTYDIYAYAIPNHQTQPVWSPSRPQIQVGQPFFINTTNPSPTWTQILNP